MNDTGKEKHPIYFDRLGIPIDADTYFRLKSEPRYWRIAEEDVGARWWVSTVWLGINHGHRGLLLFETLVASLESMKNRVGVGLASHYMMRYGTEAEAWDGHRRITKAIRRGVEPADLDSIWLIE